MDKKQIADREQFRRYAEAALAGMNTAKFRSYEMIPELAFRTAQEMMLAETAWFERYQLLALEAITADERERHAKNF